MPKKLAAAKSIADAAELAASRSGAYKRPPSHEMQPCPLIKVGTPRAPVEGSPALSSTHEITHDFTRRCDSIDVIRSFYDGHFLASGCSSSPISPTIVTISLPLAAHADDATILRFSPRIAADAIGRHRRRVIIAPGHAASLMTRRRATRSVSFAAFRRRMPDTGSNAGRAYRAYRRRRAYRGAGSKRRHFNSCIGDALVYAPRYRCRRHFAMMIT